MSHGGTNPLGLIPPVYMKCLTALHSYFGADNSDGYIAEDRIHRVAEHGYNPGLARAGIAGLVENGYLRESTIDTGINGPTLKCWEFTPRAAEYIFDRISIASQADDGQVDDKGADRIPAADRFVAVNHNSDDYLVAKKAIQDLAEAVRGSNDLFANPDERLLVVSEIEAVVSYLTHAKIRAAYVWSATRLPAVIGWLAKEAGSGIIRDFATKAIKALLALVGHPAP